MGTAWMAASQAVLLDDSGQPQSVEPEGMRFFCAGPNIWNICAVNIDPNIPFAFPVWGAAVAGWAQSGKGHVQTKFYHDVTDLSAVARLPGPDTYEPAEEGYGRLAFNTPVMNYVNPPKPPARK
jgi:hypothetical protein